MADSQILLVTGMHRSGTSLVASVLQQAGIDLGTDLLGPAIGNPRGHFEDLDFLRLQESWLEAAGLGILVTDLGAVLAPDETQRERAQELIALRREKEQWGFKDPRTTLYLDFWDQLLPTARYLFVYRHPLDVALSLDRRGSDLEAVTDPRRAFDAWTAYNQALLEFARRNRERCFLGHIEAVVANLPGFVARIGERFGLELGGVNLDLFHRDELMARVTPASHRLFGRLMPEAAELLAELDREADLRREPSEQASAEPDERLLAFGRLVPELADRRTRRSLLALLLDLLAEGHDEAIRRAVSEHQANLASHRLHASNLEGLVQEREAALRVTREHLDYVEMQFAQLERGLQTSQADAESLRAELRLRDTELDTLRSEIVHRETEIERRGTELDTLRAEIGRLGLEDQEQRTTIEELNADRNALAEHTMALETQLTEVERDQKALSDHAAELEARQGPDREMLQDLQTELEETRQHAAELGRHGANLEQLAEQHEQRIAELEQHTHNLEHELERRQERIGELERHTTNLEELQRWSHLRIRELERHATNLEQMLNPTLAESLLPEIEEMEH